jgi:hypothetical protein
MNLYSCQAAKTLRLEEFEQAQAAATDATANHLRDNWLAAIKHIIKWVVERGLPAVGGAARDACERRIPRHTHPARRRGAHSPRVQAGCAVVQDSKPRLIL